MTHINSAEKESVTQNFTQATVKCRYWGLMLEILESQFPNSKTLKLTSKPEPISSASALNTNEVTSSEHSPVTIKDQKNNTHRVP